MLPRRSSAGSLYGAQLGTDQHAIQPKERWGSAALSPRYGLPPATTMQGRAGSSGTLLRPSRPLSRGRERPPTAASSRAAYGSKGALEVAAAAIELHGGVGRQPQALPYPGAGPALERQRCDGLQQRSARPSSANAELGGRTAPAEPAALTESLVTALASPRGRGCGSPYALPASSLPLPPPAQPPASAPPESVSIHVCDDARGLRKTFRCELPLLLTHMRYFEAYLSSSRADELDISVHCDVQVFEWLMQYVRSAGGGPQPGPAVPRLEVGNCVSLLISSEFLMMGGLVAECERFIAAHASQVALLPIDLSCIHDGAIARMATALTPAMLHALVDHKGKLAPRLYAAAFAQLADGPARALMRCAHCERVFTAEQGEWEACARAQPTIGRHGALSAKHQPSPHWDGQAWLASLLEPPLSLGAMGAYWHVWGCLQTLECDACGCAFVATELGCCAYHPMDVVLPGGPDGGARHACCGQPQHGSGLLGRAALGCCWRDHVVRAHATDGSLGLQGAEGSAHGGAADAPRVASLALAMRHLVTAPVESARLPQEAQSGDGRLAQARSARRGADAADRDAVGAPLARILRKGTAGADPQTHGAASAGGVPARARAPSPFCSQRSLARPRSAACGRRGIGGIGSAQTGGHPSPQQGGLGPPGRVAPARQRPRSAARGAVRRREKPAREELELSAASSGDEELEELAAAAERARGGAGANDCASDCSAGSSSSDSDERSPVGGLRTAVGARRRRAAGGTGAVAWRPAYPKPPAERAGRARRRPSSAPARREPAVSPRRARELKLNEQRVDDQRRIERLLLALDRGRAAPAGEEVPPGGYDGRGGRALARGAPGHGWIRDEAHRLAPKPTFLRPSAIMHVSRSGSQTTVLWRPSSRRAQNG